MLLLKVIIIMQLLLVIIYCYLYYCSNLSQSNQIAAKHHQYWYSRYNMTYNSTDSSIDITINLLGLIYITVVTCHNPIRELHMHALPELQKLLQMLVTV